VKILPLTPAQASFVEVELIGRYVDDEDERTAAVMEIVSEHFGLTAATGTPGLAVPDAELLRRLILDAMNGIDDAIDKGRSESEGYGDARAARGLHKAASALYSKIKSAGLGATDMNVANTIADQIGQRAFRMLGAKDLMGDANSLTFKIGRNAQGVTHVRVQLDPDDTYTMQFLKVRTSKKPPYYERKVLSEASGIYVDQLRGIITEKTGLYTNL
jgi:hypothetical protein